MQIAPADVSDAEVILALQKLCYQSEAAIYDDYSIAPLTQTLEDLQSEFTRQVILKAVEGNTIVGSVRAYLESGTCNIGRLIVHPDYQSQGIGKQLMGAVESRFPEAQSYELFTEEKSEKNIALYQKLGYRELRKESLSPLVTVVYMGKPR